MRALIQGISDAPLLRLVWFQCFIVSLLVLALFRVGTGYEQYSSYRSAVEACIVSNIEQVNEHLAKGLKSGRYETVSNWLNATEFSCAFPNDGLRASGRGGVELVQANFFWIAERDGQEVVRVGKNMLKGPVSTLVFPLSIWSEGNSGDYWVGTVNVELYFGTFVDQLVKEQWAQFGKLSVMMFLLSIACFFWVYKKLILPNQAFAQTFRSSPPSSAAVRRIISGRDDELSNVWRAFLSSTEHAEIERYEFEAQIRDLEFHISKIERGQAGQSLSTEQASTDIKHALHRAMAIQARAAKSGDERSAMLMDYLSAVMSVTANLHERAQLESGEVMLNSIDFSLRSLIAQINGEFKERLRRRGMSLVFDIPRDLPDFVNGDPEKLKRIIRNAFKRTLLESSLSSLSFKARYDRGARNGPRFVFELSGVPERGIDQEEDLGIELTRRAPEQGPTLMLEMLCYVMGARWAFSTGANGELKQSLNLALTVVEPVLRKPLVLDSSALKGLQVTVYDLALQKHSALYNAASQLFGKVDFYGDTVKMTDRLGRSQIKPDLILVSDLSEDVRAFDFLSNLRRQVPATTAIFLVAESPQIGDAQVALECGVQALVSRNDFTQNAEDLLCAFWVYWQAAGKNAKLFTRYTMIDAIGPDERLSLPVDLVGENAKSVLLISAEQVCIEFSRMHCAKYGARLTHFDSVFVALDTYRLESFDLVIVDEGFDDIDALTVIEMLRQIDLNVNRRRNTPVVGMFTTSDEHVTEHFKKAGATDSINKSTIDGSLGKLFERYFG